MIKIHFNEPETSDWRQWCADCETEQHSHNINIESGRNSKIKRYLYKREKSFFIDPDGPFHGKCVYCEEKIISAQYGDIDHFRPTKSVVDETTRSIITVQEGETSINHPGYYWLAYVSNNLLPSCLRCNRNYKGNFFPINGTHACRPGEECNEEPLLIHPCFDDPDEHLEIDETGIFSPKNNSTKGKTCIRILNLNKRDLPSTRKEKYDEVTNKMLVLAHEMSRPEIDRNRIDILTNQISEIKKGKGEFTAAARKAIRNRQEDFKDICRI